MGDVIESGIVTDFADKLSKTILDKIKKGFDKLHEQDITLKDEKPVKDEKGNVNGFIFTAITGRGNQVHVKILNSSGRSNLYDVYIVGDNGEKSKSLHKRSDEIEDEIVKFIDKTYGESLEGFKLDENTKDINIDNGAFESNTKIEITLSKVNGSQEIIYGPIYSNYDPLDVYQDLENVIEDEEFRSDLTEDEQIFEIIPNDDYYEVNIIDEVSSMDTVSLIIRAQLISIMQLLSCKWNSDVCLDENPMSVVNTIRWQMDWLIGSRLASTNVNVLDILKSISPEEMEPNGDVSSIVENYASILDLYYPNFDHEIQHLMNDWILTLRY